jgi:5'-methylthioinosine phosphorylase
MGNKPPRIAILGGTGAALLRQSLGAGGTKDGNAGTTRTFAALAATTPAGPASATPVLWQSGGHDWLFLSRHGDGGDIPPHRVNYRANLWLIREWQPDLVIAVNAVGGIAADAAPGVLAVPDQVVDYTWGREHSFVGLPGFPLRHVEFAAPFSATARQQLLPGSR